MKISCNWLSDYLSGSYSPDTLAERITLAGLEVEEIIEHGRALPGVVIGKVLEVDKHPDADRLSVCKVDIGTEISQIVCGAPNVAKGQTVAVATVGTTLPIKDKDGNELVLRRAKIRGVESAGMICAEDELRIGDDHSGILILDDHYQVGTSFDEALNRKSDHILEISITPNRPDATCHLGVARDLSAVFDVDLIDPRINSGNTYHVTDKHEAIHIEIKHPKACHRYVGVLIKGVSITPSPQWLQDRIKAIGLRPLNNVVDATNYVLHELGQPLHAFDFDQLKENKIVVQHYDKVQSFKTLDGQDRQVPAGSLFICDGEGPVALAGIMGGENSEVTDSTTNILLESAWFEPTGIRKTSKHLALQTDASYRFERGIDPMGTFDAAIRCAELIVNIAGGKIDSEILDLHPIKSQTPAVELRHKRLVSVIGVDPGIETIERVFRRLGFGTQSTDSGWNVMIPSWRPDVEREIDLIEEIARIVDYNTIPAPEQVAYVKPASFSPWELFIREVRSVVRAMNFREIQTISLLPDTMSSYFIDPSDHVRTLNPISQDQAVLRPDLRYGFLRTIAYNFNRNIPGLALFEIGNVFRRSGKSTWIKGINEQVQLLMGVAGVKEQASWSNSACLWSIGDLKGRVHTFFDRLGFSSSSVDCTLVNDTLVWSIKGSEVAILKMTDPQLNKAFDIKASSWTVEINLSMLEPFYTQLGTSRFEAIPKFPSIEYDAAFIIDSNLTSLILETDIRHIAGELLTDIYAFDVYEGSGVGEGKKSIAYRMSFMDKSKTLTISDVDPIIKNIVKELGNRYGALLRG